MDSLKLRNKLQKGDIKAICSQTGLGRTTVSLVLNGRQRGTDTAEKVLSAAVLLVSERETREQLLSVRVDELVES